MTTATRICGEQDCTQPTGRRNHPLCYDDYLELQDGTISLCTDCQVEYKPSEFPICRNCYRKQRGESNQIGIRESGKGWETPPSEATVHPTKDGVRAVEAVRKNIELHWVNCTNHETSTIQYLVLPMLEGLGWDPKNPDQVVQEYAPTGKKWGGSHKKVDIALFANRAPIVFIEVKRLDRDFREEFRDQLKNYATNMDSGFAALTNGRYWQVSSVANGVLRHLETVTFRRDPPIAPPRS